MASATVTYEKYLDKIRQKDPSILLGSIVLYQVAESVRVPHKDLSLALEAVGLPEFIPPVPKDDDVFLRVCTSHERKRVETDNPEVFANYLMRSVSRGGGQASKQIVVEHVNAKGKRLEYTPAVALDFDGSKVNVTALTSPPIPEAMNLSDLIKRDFRRERGASAAYTLREMLRDIIVSTGATVVKPGVYFVMEKYRFTLDALALLVQMIDGIVVHQIPLINDANQQAMLRDAIEGETRTAIEKRLDEIDKMLKGPEISAAKYQRLVEEMNSIKARTAEYSELLDDALAGCDLLVGSYDAKMRKLFMHVGAD